MIYVFIGFLILVVSFVIALISLIRDSSRLESYNRGQVSQDANPPVPSGVSSVQDDSSPPADVPGDQKPKEEPIAVETVPFPWEEKQLAQTDLGKNGKVEAPLPWEDKSANGTLAKGGSLSGEVSLKDLKKD